MRHVMAQKSDEVRKYTFYYYIWINAYKRKYLIMY